MTNSIYMKKTIYKKAWVVLALTLAVLLPIAAANNSGGEEQEVSEEEAGYLDLFQGLHITGHAIDIDPAEYRLEVSGKVDRKLSLTLEELKAMDPVSVNADLVCPGFFTDTAAWTGVPVGKILEMAGVHDDAEEVFFLTVDDSYESQLDLEEIDAGTLIAYEYDGREFHRLHGYPIRLAAKGKTGSKWVKWLGKIIVK